MNEKLQAVIGRMQEQIVALTAERDGAREQRDTARAELAAAEARIGEMVKIAGGTGEGCPTCKGTHMVSGTHGLDACPVCRPEPAMGEGDDKPVSYYAECPHDPGSICVDLDENNHCEMADECGEPDLHCDFRPAQHGEGGA